MPDDQSTPGPGASGGEPSGETTPAKTVTEDQVAEIVRRAVEPLAEGLQQTASSLGNFREQFKRHLGVPDKDQKPKPKSKALASDLERTIEEKDKELEAALERIAAIENENRSTKIEAALSQELGQLSGLVDGAQRDLRLMVQPHLKLNTQGNVVVDFEGKHHALSDFLKEAVAERPHFVSPTQRAGTKRSESVGGQGKANSAFPSDAELGRMSLADIEKLAFEIETNKPSKYGD